MATLVMDQDGKIFEDGSQPQEKGKSYSVIYQEGSEPDDAVLDSIRPGLAKEVRDRANVQAPVTTEGAAEEKAVEQGDTEDKAVEGPRGRRGA